MLFLILFLPGRLPSSLLFELTAAMPELIEIKGLDEKKLWYLFNRFDAVSAYMRKMDRYGLSDF